MKLIVLLITTLSLGYSLLVPQIDGVGIRASFPSGNVAYEAQVEKPHPRDPLLSSKNEENYIVVLKNGHAPAEYEAHQKWVNEQCSNKQKRSGIIQRVKDTFLRQKERSMKTFNFGSFKGYAGKLPKEILYSLQQSEMVDFIEKDEQVFLTEAKVQRGAPWGLERISHRIPTLSSFEEYIYHEIAGEGVTVYVVDNGINEDNIEFEGRLTSSLQNGFKKGSALGKGHGTHVAGIIGSKTFGVSKKVCLVSLDVFNETGSAFVSTIIMAIQYAINDHKRCLRARDPSYRGAVINILAQSVPSEALDQAVKKAFDAGIPVVVSAGNSCDDACKYSPSRSRYSITVGATDDADRFAAYSNWGSCVDLLAPGNFIESVGSGKELSVIKSGTSMAAPHVSGVLAILLALQPPRSSEFYTGALVSATHVKNSLLNLASIGLISLVPALTPNRFLYNGGDEVLDKSWT